MAKRKFRHPPDHPGRGGIRPLTAWKIRILLARGWNKTAIAGEVGCGRDTIYRILRATHPTCRAGRQPLKPCDRCRGRLRLGSNWKARLIRCRRCGLPLNR